MCTNGDLRAVEANITHDPQSGNKLVTGRVQLCILNQWSDVCSTDAKHTLRWHQVDQDVACKQLRNENASESVNVAYVSLLTQMCTHVVKYLMLNKYFYKHFIISFTAHACVTKIDLSVTSTAITASSPSSATYTIGVTGCFGHEGRLVDCSLLIERSCGSRNALVVDCSVTGSSGFVGGFVCTKIRWLALAPDIVWNYYRSI